MASPTKLLLVLLLTALVTAASLLMIGPQFLFLLPLMVVAGVFLAFRRSFLSLACFGYPFSFGMVSAYIGYSEIADYTRT